VSDPTVLARDAGHNGRYIVNRRPSERAIALYCAAATALFAEVEERDAVLVFVRGNPWAIPLLDAALALVDPRAVLRRRLAIMFAILETQPELAFSGVRKQRVAIARALMNRPDLVIADEPTGNLDRESADQVLSLLSEVNREDRTTFLICTHDEEVAKRCTRRIGLNDGRVADPTSD